MKIARIYVRVSTMEQASEGYSIPAQKERLLNYCKAKDYIVDDIYIDGGHSGSNLDRPEMSRLLKDIENKPTDIVAVYKLDRISRSQKDTLYLIEDVFLKKGISFVSMQESLDTSTAFGRAMIGILSVFAQLERENTKERTRMGRIERAKQGLWSGPPTPPIGYDLVDYSLIINEYEALQVKEIFDLYLKGYGTQRIQNVFNEKGYTTKYGDWNNISLHTVTRIIQNRAYIGKISFEKKWYEGIHTPIIDVETFEKANMLREKRKGKRRPLKYFLTGLLYCESCGAKYITDIKHGKSIHICKSRKLGYKQDFKCMNAIFKTDDLEEQAINKIKAMVWNKERVIEEISNLQKDQAGHEIDVSIITSRIEDIDKQISKLMDLYQLEIIPVEEISSRVSRLHEEKKKLYEENKDEPLNDKAGNMEEVLDLLEEFDEVWNALGIEQKREITSLLLGEKILINNRGL